MFDVEHRRRTSGRGLQRLFQLSDVAEDLQELCQLLPVNVSADRLKTIPERHPRLDGERHRAARLARTFPALPGPGLPDGELASGSATTSRRSDFETMSDVEHSSLTRWGRELSFSVLVTVEPSLTGMEAAVREQLGGARAELDALAEAGGLDPLRLPEAFGGMGQLYLAYDLVEPAVACLRNAHALAPGDFRWLYYLGVVYQTEPSRARTRPSSYVLTKPSATRTGPLSFIRTSSPRSA